MEFLVTQSAREAKKGLWADPPPMPPWVWRKRQRGQSVSRDEMFCFQAKLTPREMLQTPRSPGSQELAALPMIGKQRSVENHIRQYSGYSQINLEN
jgi:hypothetical protein